LLVPATLMLTTAAPCCAVIWAKSGVVTAGAAAAATGAGAVVAAELACVLLSAPKPAAPMTPEASIARTRRLEESTGVFIGDPFKDR
jgi:hypothetical protein